MVEKQKIEDMVAKCHRNSKEMSSSSKEEGNYESDTKDDTVLDQANSKYPLQY